MENKWGDADKVGLDDVRSKIVDGMTALANAEVMGRLFTTGDQELRWALRDHLCGDIFSV